MALSTAERRQYERIEAVQAIFVEVVTPGSRKETENSIFKCETVDVSIKGLRIFATQRIELGARLNLAVPQDGWIENLELVGEARWVGEAEDRDGYWVGLELQDTSKENMEKWFKVVSTLRK